MARGSRPRVAGLLQTAQHSARAAAAALDAGRCGDAVEELLHAYAMRGEAEGYAKAIREHKGRRGASITIIDDPRVRDLPRLRIRLRNTCTVK